MTLDSYGDKYRILVVDDDAAHRKATSRALDVMGYVADTANDGRGALAARLSGRYHLILMDCQMPELSGYEATRRIRQHELAQGLPRIPIIALTASAVPEDEAACKGAGMDAHLPKPIHLKRLETCMAEFCHGVAEGAWRHDSLHSPRMCGRELSGSTGI